MQKKTKELEVQVVFIKKGINYKHIFCKQHVYLFECN